MPSGSTDIYQRGRFWLDYVRGAGRKPASSRLYIWWYDPDSGRLRRKSTGESDVRLASDKLDEHYHAHHRPTRQDQEVYTVSEALIDYWLEHGSNRASRDSIKARLKLVTRFIEHEFDTGRLRSALLPNDLDKSFLAAFRAWALADPIVARKKDANGKWVNGASRKRSEATVEESIIQLKAALNHALESKRVAFLPSLKHRPRDEVTSERSYRLSIDGLAELLDYSTRGAGRYAGHADRLIPLRRYLVGAICTLGRPDAVLDMSVAEERGQWMREERRFALNPEGRIQTKKVRPVMPVIDLLHDFLSATDEWLVCKIVRSEQADGTGLTEQLRVASVRSGWDGARAELGIPDGWGPKLIRHSVSTILARHRVNLVELEIALGHRVMKKTTSRYAHLDPDYLKSISDCLQFVADELSRKIGHALQPGAATRHIG